MWLVKVSRLFMGLVTLYVAYTSFCWQEDYQYISTEFDEREYLIDSHDISHSPYESAELYLNEVNRVLEAGDEHWKIEMNSTRLIVMSKPINGSLSRYKLPLQRARLHITSYLDKDDLFAYIISPVGLAMLDPVSVSLQINSAGITSNCLLRSLHVTRLCPSL